MASAATNKLFLEVYCKPEKEKNVNLIYSSYDTNKYGSLNAEQLQAIYERLRDSTLSIPQIEASMSHVCSGYPAFQDCDEEELLDVLDEMDRRFFLAQDLQWEFSMLDRQGKGSITVTDAMFLFQVVHGEYFSMEKFNVLMSKRLSIKCDVTFQQIEVELCNIPTCQWIKEQMDAAEEREAKKIAKAKQEEREMMEAKEEEKRKMEQIKKSKEQREKNEKELADQKIQEDAARTAEEERLKKEEDKRLKKEEEQRLKKEEEQRLKREEDIRDAEKGEKEKRKMIENAHENWKELKDLGMKQLLPEDLQTLKMMKESREVEEAGKEENNAQAISLAEDNAINEFLKAEEMLKNAASEEERIAAEQAKESAAAEALEKKEKRLRLQLGVAVKLRNRPKLNVVVNEAKESKIEALKADIEKAEKVSDSVKCGEDLEDAMVSRVLPLIEEAIATIKNKSYETDHMVQILEAEKLISKLRRLEKSKKDILELNQRTIAIIRSYSQPIPAIREVMIGTYIILGYKEKELKEWKYIQALLGRTGKESLKRMCTTLEASKVDLNAAKVAESKYFKNYDLQSITEISAGIGTFYAWSTNIIEEARNWVEDSDFRKKIEEKRKLDIEETKKLQTGREGKEMKIGRPKKKAKK